MGTAPTGFSEIDWDAPIDVAAYIARAPDDALIRGMLIAGIAERMRAIGKPLPGAERFVAFKGYPMRMQMQILVNAARLLAPEGIRRGLREIGRMAFPSTQDHMVGRVILGLLGRDVRAILSAGKKMYDVVGSRGDIVVKDIGDRHAHLHMTKIYAFPDAYHVGVLEGVVLTCGFEPTVMLRVHDLNEIEMFATWRPAGSGA